MMDEVQALCGFTITAVKGSPDATPGSSAGTHDGEGVIDVVGPDLDLIVFNGRKVGFAGWHRTVAEGFVPHDHLVAVGEPDLSPQAADQVTDYFEGRNGLVTNAPDDGPRDFVGQTWEGYLGGDPAPGGAQVFRGEQVSIADVVVTAGSLDPYSDIFTGIETRTDSTAVTLTAGDEFYIYLNAADTVSTDVYSLINWRLNASGHGAVALADSFDTGWSYTPPVTWASLGTITLDRDDLLLTATPASAALADSTKLDGSTGSPLLRVTCTTGTVTLDWACLQVEPPAGLLVTSGSHWSQWFTPNLVEHGVAGVGSGVVEGVGNITGSITDQDTAQAAVEDAEADAVADMADELWDPIVFDDPDPNPLRAAYLQAWAKLTAYAQFGFAHVELQSAFQGAEWGTWPDYRQMPPELDALAAKGEVATDHGFPLYEFDDGDTSSVRWHGKVIEGDLSLTRSCAPGISRMSRRHRRMRPSAVSVWRRTLAAPVTRWSARWPRTDSCRRSPRKSSSPPHRLVPISCWRRLTTTSTGTASTRRSAGGPAAASAVSPPPPLSPASGASTVTSPSFYRCRTTGIRSTTGPGHLTRLTPPTLKGSSRICGTGNATTGSVGGRHRALRELHPASYRCITVVMSRFGRV